MKKLITLALAAVLCALSLASCGPTIKTGEQGLYDKKNDISYIHAPTAYEAAVRGKKYGKLKINDQVSLDLFIIPGLEPTEVLTTEDNNIVYASTYALPSLLEMAPSAVHVCVEGKETAHTLFSITDVADIASLIDAYTKGQPVDYPGTVPMRSYRVRFESRQYIGFYYTLTYMEYASDLTDGDRVLGRCFLYDRFEERFVPVGDEIRKVLDEGTDAEAGDTTADEP